MPTKRCRYGFSCSSMMMQPDLTADSCPNRDTCGLLTELTPDEVVELRRVREVERQRWEEQRQLWLASSERLEETIRVNQWEAAVLMLRIRGCPQTGDTLGVSQPLSSVTAKLEQLSEKLEQLEQGYIAPPGCEAHHYNVKRPRGTYEYNKLTAETPMFSPSERNQNVRVIHLSHDDDARNLAARQGIAKRNDLLRLASQLAQLDSMLDEVLASLEE